MRRLPLALFAVCLLLVLAAGPLSTPALAAPGDLDLSFGENGIAYTGVPFAPDGVATQSDGKIVAVWDTSRQDGLAMVRRYTADGALDTSFGEDGSVTLPDGATGFARLMIQPGTDRIIVQQETTYERRYLGENSVYQNRLVVLTKDGTLDLDFGNDGVLTTPDDALYVPICYDMAPDGSLVGGGYAYANDGDLAVFKYAAEGAVDTSFGNGGVVTESLANRTFDIVCGLGVLHDGRILLAGMIHTRDGFFLRLRSDGSHDPTFHQGKLYIRPNAQDSPVERGRIVELQNGDLLIFIHWRWDPYRLPADCVMGGEYKGFVNLPRRGDCAMTSDGGLVAAGIVYNGYPTYWDFVIRRFTPWMLPDETFAPKGTVVKDFGSPEDYLSSAVLPDGRVLVAGVASGMSPSMAHRGRAAERQGLFFRLKGGSRTNLATKLKRGGSSPVSKTRRSGVAKWSTTAKLTCNGTAVGGAKVKLMRSRNARKWTSVVTLTTQRRGTVTTTVRLTRKGTYYFRWTFAGTQAYRKSTAAITKVVVK